MACIYHIYSTEDTNTVYIGQTTQDPEPRYEQPDGTESKVLTLNKYQARPMDHFSGLYTNMSENPMFSNWVKQHPLNSMVVEIYDESQYYGLSKQILDSFCSYWFTERAELDAHSSGDKVDLSEKTKDLSKYYLDAAEIIHNYIAYRLEHKQILSYQIGGQTYNLRAPNGVVLNTTTSIASGCTILEQGSDLSQLEEEFHKELTKQLDDSDFITELSDAMVNDMLENKTKNIRAKGSKTLKFTTQQKRTYNQILAKYVRQALRNVQHGYAADLLRAKGYEIHTVYDNLYSQYLDKWLINFNGSQHYNIIDAMIGRLTTQDLRRKLDKPQSLSESLQTIADFLKNKVSLVVPDTSVGSFFDIVPPKDAMNMLQWQLGSPSHIHDGSSKDPYGLSFRHRAYWAFRRAVLECLQDPEIKYGSTYDFRDGKIIRITTYKLSNALLKYFKKLGNPYILKHWNDYLHAMLTIYTRNNEVTIGGHVYAYEIVDDKPFLITDQTPEFVHENEKEEDNQIQVLMAYRFSQATFDDMVEWSSNTWDDLEHY